MLGMSFRVFQSQGYLVAERTESRQSTGYLGAKRTESPSPQGTWGAERNESRQSTGYQKPKGLRSHQSSGHLGVIRLSLGRRLVNLSPVAQRTNAFTLGGKRTESRQSSGHLGAKRTESKYRGTGILLSKYPGYR